MPKTTHDLAKTLSEQERLQLLKKLTDNLALSETHENVPVQTKPSLTKRQQDIHSGMEGMNLWEKIKLLLRTVFSSKVEEDVFIDMQLKKIYRHIQDQDIECVRGTLLTTDFVRLYVRFYKILKPFLSLYAQLWQESALLINMVNFILEKKIPQTKQTLSDFTPIEELQKYFTKHENKQVMKTRVVEKINHYFARIPTEIFQEIGESILTLYHYKNLALFNFTRFITAFKGESPEGNVVFLQVDLNYILNELEELYFALNNVQEIRLSGTIHKEIFDYITLIQEDMVQTGEIEHSPQHILREVGEAVKDFLDRSQILNIIKIAKNDPYYEIASFHCTLDIRNFYNTSLQLKIMDELEASFVQIRRNFIANQKDKIFREPMNNFENYRRGLSDSNTKMQSFHYVNSLQFLYHFLKYRFEKDFIFTLKIISRFLMTHDRERHSDFAVSVSVLENLADKIRYFDQNLAPLADEGKKFHMLRAQARDDASRVEFFNEYIQQKNAEVTEYLNQGDVLFTTLNHHLSRLRGIDSSDIYNTLSLEIENNRKMINRMLEEIKIMQKILFYERQLEDER